MFLKVSQYSQVFSSFIKIDILAQVLSCEFYKVFKNAFSQNTSKRLLCINIESTDIVSLIGSSTHAAEGDVYLCFTKFSE